MEISHLGTVFNPMVSLLDLRLPHMHRESRGRCAIIHNALVPERIGIAARPVTRPSRLSSGSRSIQSEIRQGRV